MFWRLPAVVGLIIATAIGGSVQAQGTAATPVSVFSERPIVTDPELSPDGRRAAARGTVRGKSSLAIIDLDRPGLSPRIFGVADGEIADINWAGDQRVLVTISVPGAFFGLPMLRLIAIDLHNNTMKVLDPKSRGLFGGVVLHADPDGGWALVSSQDSLFETPSVKRVDLSTGSATLIERARANVWNWYADDQGVVRAGIAYEGRRWTVWYRATAADPLKAARGKLPKDDDGAVDSLRFLAGDRTGIIITNSRTGRFAVYRYDFQTGEIGQAIYEHPKVDVTSIVADPITGAVEGVKYEDDRRHIAWLDPQMGILQRRLEKALPDAENVIVGQSRDKNRVLIWSAGAARPGLYYLFDQAANLLTPVIQPYGSLADTRLAPVTPVSYAARDGLTIPAYLTLPRERAAGRLPLILMPHGGPFERDSWEYDPFVQFLASRGYAVLQPQFRGSTGYGRDFVKKGYGEWGRKMQDDLDDGVEWLVASGKADPKRVCIMGASYGGYAALWGAIRNPERYRCAISLAGVTDLSSQMRYSRKSFAAPRYFRQWQDVVKGEGDKGVELSSVSPAAQAARLKVPVLIAHGENDEVVPPLQARKMIDALKQHRTPVDTVFYKDEGHGLSKKENVEDYLKRVEAFLTKHNPA